MKTIKKAISLLMAVIMLFTGTSVLSAADLVLDTTQITKLQEEISLAIDKSNSFQTPKDIYAEIPDWKELEALYNEANKNYKELKEKIKSEETEIFHKEIKEKIRELAKNDTNFEDFKDQEGFEKIVFYSYLFEDIANAEKKGVSSKILGVAIPLVTLDMFYLEKQLIGSLHSKILQLWLEDGESIASGEALYSFGLSNAIKCTTLLFLLLLPSNGFNPSLPTSEIQSFDTPIVTNEKVFAFLEDPFSALAVFHERNKNDFEKFFNIDITAAQILFDAVYIEWYISHNPTLSNMKYRIYPHTLEWKTMFSAEERKDKLHEIAELLRAQSRQGAKEQFSKLRVGLEER